MGICEWAQFSAAFTQIQTHGGTPATWLELHSLPRCMGLPMSALDDLSHPITPTPPHWIAPSPWMPDVQSFPSSISLTNNSSIWKTPFPPLHTSNHPESLNVKVASFRKPLLITNQGLSFASISISQVSVTPHCQHLLCAKPSSKQGRR